jgi:hypothetical protein
MVEQVVGVVSISLFVLGLAMLAVGARRRRRARRATRLLCPGPHRRWGARLRPQRLVVRSMCGYDLTGLRQRDGTTTCPECGSQHGTQTHYPKLTSRLRASVVGSMLVGLSVAGWVLTATRDDNDAQWLKPVPSVALIVGYRVLGAETPQAVRRALATRMDNNELTKTELGWYAHCLTINLRSDHKTGNASNACWRLASMPEAEPALQASLLSADWQERQLAAIVLHDLWRTRRGIVITPHLLRVTVEGLGDDEVPAGGGYYTNINNAQSGFWFLCEIPDPTVAEQVLSAGMMSLDRQRRLLSAAAAGATGQTRLLSRAAPILIEHLHDNDIESDATLAIGALYRFGSPVTPYLKECELHGDDQARRLSRLALEDLDPEFVGPPSADGALYRCDPVTISVANPARELVVRSINIRWNGRGW